AAGCCYRSKLRGKTKGAPGLEPRGFTFRRTAEGVRPCPGLPCRFFDRVCAGGRRRGGRRRDSPAGSGPAFLPPRREGEFLGPRPRPGQNALRLCFGTLGTRVCRRHPKGMPALSEPGTTVRHRLSLLPRGPARGPCAALAPLPVDPGTHAAVQNP